ncbi:phytoene desaturase family protein [Lentzea sp. NBRC 102530]|uniref:phytoene desaturase family protein n=1 Tax=Lentzea sp. NBRC 102530 TaxID=3032201 RepID=UPI0024A520B0|nr:phytoene desaturase family protein [Lentzea sp. NBRC 102530]GLY49405.1 phytoene dehydrogenase [Lentzea sp. NBRC 102530]
MPDHVIVVGAGLAGLSAAMHLQGTGRRVTVVEKGDVPGGRAGTVAVGGFAADSGPTVLTMPEYLDEAFGVVGERLSDWLTLDPVTPAYRARFADGSRISVHTDAAAMEDEVRTVCGAREAAGYRELRRWLGELYSVQRAHFIGANFDSPLDLVRPELVRLAALGGFGRLESRLRRFLRDERLIRLFSFQALYAGVPPQQALAAYAVIAYMDTIAGVYYPRGGMRAVPEAMAAAAVKHGAEFRYDASVTRLEWRGARVVAVHVGEERIACDAVVLACELPDAYRLLGKSPSRVVPHRWSPSAVVLHAATDRTWDLGHHNILFGRAWRGTFDEIVHRGRLMSDPSLLVTHAQDGLHYVLAPAPNLEVGLVDWRRVGPRYRDELVRTLEARGLDGFGAAVRDEVLVTPADWGNAAGTPFGLAHTFAQTGPFRPRNVVRGVENVALAGAGTTPGVGVPPVLISGRLAAQRTAAVRR